MLYVVSVGANYWALKSIPARGSDVEGVTLQFVELDKSRYRFQANIKLRKYEAVDIVDPPLSSSTDLRAEGQKKLACDLSNL